jgi:hypothetical protein
VTLAKFSGSLAGVVALSALAVGALLGAPAVLPALLGALLAAANAISAYALVRWSAGRSTRAFVRAILGGMTLRLLTMLAAVFVALKIAGLAPRPFLISLLAHFAAFLAFELALVHRAPARLQAAR